MHVIIPESELRAREQALLARLNDQPRHESNIIFEAVALGLAMGSSGVETALLHDPETAGAVSAVTVNMLYPSLIRENVVHLIILPNLKAALMEPSLEVGADEVKQTLLATAVLGNLRFRTKLG